MSPSTALWHLLNLFAVPLMLGLLAPALAKLFWPQALKGRPWRRLAAQCFGCCALLTVGGLALSGHDGRTTTYAAMVLACTAVLVWASRPRPGG